MTHVLLTGMSGTGKSSLVRELAARGYTAIDADADEWSELVATGGSDGVDGTRDLLWREDRIRRLLATTGGDALFVAGCAPNQVKFYPRFDHIVLLTAPAELIAERLATRTNNPYGKRPDELARTLALKNTVEPRLRSVADLEVDTSAPLAEVVSAVLRLLR